MYAILTRFTSNEKGVTGLLQIFEDTNECIFSCLTLELPWKNNQFKISCIPAGVYKLLPHNSPKFKKCFSISGVPFRSAILIHVGNTIADSEGCILVGRKLFVNSGLGTYFLENSRVTLESLLFLIDEPVILKIDNSITLNF